MSLRPNVENVEEMMDSGSVLQLVESIAQVCSEKADHIRENWQDMALADEWDTLAARFLNDAMYLRDRAQVFGFQRD